MSIVRINNIIQVSCVYIRIIFIIVKIKSNYIRFYYTPLGFWIYASVLMNNNDSGLVSVHLLSHQNHVRD